MAATEVMQRDGVRVRITRYKFRARIHGKCPHAWIDYRVPIEHAEVAAEKLLQVGCHDCRAEASP